MLNSNRRYDIDWLRVITIGLLLIYHVSIVFQPWGVFIGFIQSTNSLEWIWTPMSMLNIWRIPLLFFISGVGVAFAIRKRSIRKLLFERTKRILLPFIVGILVIVPIHILIWQNYYNQELNYILNPSHLWFLGNIFAYVVILSPFIYYLKKGEKIVKGLQKMFSHPIGLLLISTLFVIEAILVNPDVYVMYAMTLHGFLLGMLAFFFGVCFVLCEGVFWETTLNWRWVFLSIAMLLYSIRLIVYQLESPNYLMGLESTIWVFTVFGFGYKHLNKSNKALLYLSEAAYPIYIIHMAFLYIGANLIVPLEISALLKFALLIGFTFFGSFGTYELVIRKVSFLRPLFGLTINQKESSVRYQSHGHDVVIAPRRKPLIIGVEKNEERLLN